MPRNSISGGYGVVAIKRPPPFYLYLQSGRKTEQLKLLIRHLAHAEARSAEAILSEKRGSIVMWSLLDKVRTFYEHNPDAD